MSLYFEDLPVGHEHLTRGRTITETDIVNFAGLSGDYNEIHTNEEYARETRFGRRVVHGMLTLSISSGLSVRTNLLLDSIIAFYGIDKLRFQKPVFAGDTIHVRKRVIEAAAKGAEMGLVTFEAKVVNQRGETVLSYHEKLVIKQRGSAPGA